MRNLSELKGYAASGWAVVVREYQKLSPILKASVIAGVALLVLWIGLAIVEPVFAAFQEQTAAMQRIKQTAVDLEPKLGSYARLKARREAIESRYKEVEIREGAFAYLERLVKAKAGVPAGQFTIQERTSKEFGGNYEQVTYSIKFSTSDMKALTTFLNELVRGQHPLILGRLEIAMNARNEALDVDLDATTIKRTGGG